jgi:hypothetical protein
MARRGHSPDFFGCWAWQDEYADELDAPKNALYKPRGTPRARESTSQLAQLTSTHRHATNKGMKMSISKK